MEPLTLPIELLKYFFAGYLLLLLGRAVAARIAGPHAALVLDAPLINIPITINRTPLPPHSDDDDEEDDGETGNTETLENTGNTAVSTVSEYITVNDSAGSRLVKRMTQEEFEEFTAVRNDALALLKLCVEYHRKMNEVDDGIIPHYLAFKNKARMEIGIGAQTRGDIVRNLEYSSLVSVIDRKSTRVVPAIDLDSDHPILIGSCAELAKLIVRGRVWVYPDGYNERKQKLLDDAVMALPKSGRDD